MKNEQQISSNTDNFDLDRFVTAQNNCYEKVLAELSAGRKTTHWMWYIFPQYRGLGYSPTSIKFAISSLAEANAYIKHPVLGPRLVDCVKALLKVKGRSATEILGFPDDKKLQSCATLFLQLEPQNSIFGELLEVYFKGQPDPKTLELLLEDSPE
jgi:uncharacterized protein (DUF1810 family)